MDDKHTKEALDALADLFLTGISPQEGGPAPRQEQDNPLSGPSPIRLKPKVAQNATFPDHDDEDSPGAQSQQELLAAVTGSRPPTQVQLGEKPFLRLADEDEQPEPAQPARPRETKTQNTQSQPATAMVEAVLLGNLPGVSGPWMQQYAQVLADQDGPVALLHVGGERIDIELIEPRATAGQTHPVIQMSRDADQRPAVVTLLDSLVRADNAPVTNVLVHVEPAVDGSEALRLFAIDDWTVLCGADDAAVVGAYRMLKERSDTDVTVQEKRVGLMVMGADQANARAAASRIKAAADSFLHTPVTLVGWQKQMMPVHVRQLGTFEGVAAIWPRLCDWFATLEPPQLEVEEPQPAEESQANEPVQEVPDEATEQAETKVEPEPKSQPKRSAVMDIPAPKAKVQPQPKPAASQPKAEPRPAPRVTPRVPPAPKPEPTRREVQPKPAPAAAVATAADDKPILSELIDTLPGSIALEARCPHQPDTEIVIDQEGVLHLLAHHEADSGDLEQTITKLLAARQWVDEHRKLLAMTQRQLRLDEQAAPTLHLFTARAELATKLVARLGDQLKLHLLQTVSVGDQSTWFTTALN